MRQLCLLLLVTFVSVFGTPNCATRTFPDGNVCVCNSTHCDDIEPLGSIPLGNAAVYRSDSQGARMDRVVVKQKSKPDGLVVVLDSSTLYQEIMAFTDSAGFNIRSLPKDTQDLLMKQYFGPTGTEYNLARVPIASTDFSFSEYQDDVSSETLLTTTHERHPDKFILATEACNGWLILKGQVVRLGLFFRAERYAHSIITDLNNWVTGWTDWNMVLDMQGGPSWVGNSGDAPIIVDGEEFYKQPMYYALAHFSKFLKPGARRARVVLPNLPQLCNRSGSWPRIEPRKRTTVVASRSLRSQR